VEQTERGESPHPNWVEIIADAAIEAEFETGEREETVEEARRHVVLRLLSIVGGFTLIGLGIALLPLPGPGWLIILLGLDLLPFAWAERTIRLIRRRIPGVPEEGRIPVRTWLVMGVMIAIFSAVGIVWGNDISNWFSGRWGDPDRLFG
jgi:hypothetical protein